MSQIRQSSGAVERRKFGGAVGDDPRRQSPLKSAATEAGCRRSLSDRSAQPVESAIEQRVAPAAIERALSIYQRLREHDRSVEMQARKILTKRIYAMVDEGESDEHRLTVGGLNHLKSIEREHAIKSASDSQNKKPR